MITVIYRENELASTKVGAFLRQGLTDSADFREGLLGLCGL